MTHVIKHLFWIIDHIVIWTMMLLLLILHMFIPEMFISSDVKICPWLTKPTRIPAGIVVQTMIWLTTGIQSSPWPVVANEWSSSHQRLEPESRTRNLCPSFAHQTQLECVARQSPAWWPPSGWVETRQCCQGLETTMQEIYHLTPPSSFRSLSHFPGSPFAPAFPFLPPGDSKMRLVRLRLVRLARRLKCVQ